ncbi:MAG: DUF5659 domain-containing protein [Candidatus Peribacteraceae bacterium]|nr:DUF5659 domain-containing protein [Candidatus Peribacteraceae bacterium]
MQDFRTPDLPTATVLLHKNCRFLGLDRADPKRAVFVFEDSEKLQRILREYWRDELLCPAQSLLSDFKRAKHILFDHV